MDNYVTYSKTLKGTRDLGVAAFGTAKAKRGWPPKEIKNVSDMRFNTLYWMHDKDDYLIMRWVDNSVVTMVSTFHNPSHTTKRQGRSPELIKSTNYTWKRYGETITCAKLSFRR